MKLSFKVPKLAQVLDSTLWTQEDDITPYWRNQFYDAYPEIDKGKALALSEKDRLKYIEKILTEIYSKKQGEFQKLATTWQNKWNSCAKKIESAFAAAYEIDVKPILNDMVAYVNLNPVCPRYLDKHSFYVFYDMDEGRVMRTCLHEIMHFLWFYKWQEHFHDNPAEYDTPHLKWIFSEMVQETMMADTPIKNLSAWSGNTYDYFYCMKIEGKSILKTLSDIHKAKGLAGLFKDGFDYCLQHEREIRLAIEQSEKSEFSK